MRKDLRRLCQIAVLAAVVFAASGLRIQIPLAVGDTAVHLGNVPCLLAGLLLGPAGGGLASGMGAAIYDLTNPLYVSSAPFTFVFKFLLGAVAGLIAHSGGRAGTSLRRNLVGAVAGSVTYTALYVGKSFLTNVFFLEMPLSTAWVTVLPKLGASALNGAVAIIASIPLAAAVRLALKKSGYELA